MNSAAEWVASIPDQLTAREALVYIQQALDDAKAATDTIVAQYQGGTLPPPPWPQQPLLVQAVDAMEGGRKMLQQAIAMGYGDRKEPKSGPTGTRLLNGGRALYREIAIMQKADREGKTTAPELAARAAAAVVATPWGGLLAIGGLLWLLHHYGDE